MRGSQAIAMQEMRSHSLSRICLVKYLYWLLDLCASGYSQSPLSIWMNPGRVRVNGILQMGHIIAGDQGLHYFVGQVSPSGQCGLLASCQLGALLCQGCCGHHGNQYSHSDGVWSVWHTDTDTHFMKLPQQGTSLYVVRTVCIPWETAFCTGLCHSYNGSCEIWTDTLPSSSSYPFFSLSL